MDESEFSVELAGAGGLPQVASAMTELAEHALDPNPFYEPWMLLPALNILDNVDRFSAALVWRRGRDGPAERPQLVGLFPATDGRQYRWLPISVSHILAHLYCFSSTPLVHKEYASEALQAYFDWLSKPGAPVKIVHFEKLPADGAFHSVLVDIIRSRALIVHVERRYLRAVYRCITGALDARGVPVPERLQKRLDRQKTRLQEIGNLEYRRLDLQGDADEWAQAFLDLEASGWKGRKGTALACLENHAQFFREIARGAHALGRLDMSGLWLNDRVIAARIGFRAGDGVFLFKIAYDQTYEKYSPGNLLELEHLRCGLGGGEVWEDSCAAAGDLTSRRLSPDCRPVEDMAVSLGSTYGDFILSILPLLAFAKRYCLRL